MDEQVEYTIAVSDTDFEQGKKLFREYVDALRVDLSFQDFEYELQMIDKQYHQPAGALILAMQGEHALGCAGIRKLDDGTAELKRMYVRDLYRDKGIGFSMLHYAMTLAVELGYTKIRLDTLQNMTKAQELYRSVGFYVIAPYRFNPLEGTVFMEKEL